MTARLRQRGLWHVTMGESLPPSEPTLFEPVAPATTLSRIEESHNYAAQRDYDTKLEAWAEKDEKAQGDLLAHIVDTRVSVTLDSLLCTCVLICFMVWLCHVLCLSPPVPSAKWRSSCDSSI
jgi:hypothetical protein